MRGKAQSSHEGDSKVELLTKMLSQIHKITKIGHSKKQIVIPQTTPPGLEAPTKIVATRSHNSTHHTLLRVTYELGKRGGG